MSSTSIDLMLLVFDFKELAILLDSIDKDSFTLDLLFLYCNSIYF
jgi:hypothetical protein